MWGPRTAIALGASSASQGSSLTPVGSPDFPVIGAMKSGTTSLCQQTSSTLVLLRYFLTSPFTPSGGPAGSTCEATTARAEPMKFPAVTAQSGTSPLGRRATAAHVLANRQLVRTAARRGEIIEMAAQLFAYMPRVEIRGLQVMDKRQRTEGAV
jgi:hypothetical protein